MQKESEEKHGIFDKPLPIILDEIQTAARDARKAADEARVAGEKAAEDVMKRLRKLFLKMSKDITVKVDQETYASGLDVRTEAQARLKERKSWDLGNLANSILVDRSSDGSIVEIGPTAPYGPYVELGTKPHFPPPDALEGWAKRHGFDSAWPICKAIAERGLPENPYLWPAFLAVEGKYFKRLKGILGK